MSDELKPMGHDDLIKVARDWLSKPWRDEWVNPKSVKKSRKQAGE